MGTLGSMLGKAYRAILLAPILWWAFRIVMGRYGADPAKSFNHATGEMALYYLLGNLALGALIGFGVRFPAWIRLVLLGRRWLGVVTFVFLVFHVFFYLAMEGFEGKAFVQAVTKLYLIFGLSAWVILLLMALTSNDFSLRRMGFKWWKRLHRFVHLAAFFVMGHTLLIEKGDLVKYGCLFALLWALQAGCFLWRKMKKRAA